MSDVPEIRVRLANAAAMVPEGRYVLYWMTAARRTNWNFALDRAREWAVKLKRPLVVFEPLRVGYQWASDRLHRFVIEGMAANAKRLERTPVGYFPYVEPDPDADKGLLAALAAEACVVVTDDFPCFFLPRMVDAAAGRLKVKCEAVDANGIVPLRSTEQVFTSAYQFRRWLHKNMRPHLAAMPAANPLRRVTIPPAPALPQDIVERWPPADLDRLLHDPAGLAALPIDHAVGPGLQRGGSGAAAESLGTFVDDKLASYLADRNQPECDVASGLSPYLHFGHVSAHQVFMRVAESESWSSERLAAKATGSRAGWWGMSEAAEAFLDQLVTWRELGFNMAAHRDDFDRYDSLPEWAQKSLALHAADSRPHRYTLEQFEGARTHDPLWNAAQTQLVREGRLHNYLRMLWGKKILEWSASPREALDTMIELNNKYALDGRDPNSYSGIFWVLGRYDRPWGPERPILGKVRYMSSENTARKVSVRGYLDRYAPT